VRLKSLVKLAPYSTGATKLKREATSTDTLPDPSLIGNTSDEKWGTPKNIRGSKDLQRKRGSLKSHEIQKTFDEKEATLKIQEAQKTSDERIGSIKMQGAQKDLRWKMRNS
jgi:hypothetical protein